MIKKVLVVLGIVLAGLTLLYFIIGFLLPNKMQSKAKIEINAPIQKIYTEVANVKNWNNWAYWFIIDKSLKTEYGADFVSFDSSDYAGKLTIVEKKQNSYVKCKIEMEGMMGLTDIVVFTSSPDGKSVSVEWITEWITNGSVHNVALKPLYYFVGWPVMSWQFEASLSNLKNITES